MPSIETTRRLNRSSKSWRWTRECGRNDLKTQSLKSCWIMTGNITKKGAWIKIHVTIYHQLTNKNEKNNDHFDWRRWMKRFQRNAINQKFTWIVATRENPIPYCNAKKIRRIGSRSETIQGHERWNCFLWMMFKIKSIEPRRRKSNQWIHLRHEWQHNHFQRIFRQNDWMIEWSVDLNCLSEIYTMKGRTKRLVVLLEKEYWSGLFHV